MVTYQYAPAVEGGAERQAQRLAEGLAARGRCVGVVTPRYPGLSPCERLGGVEVYRVWAVAKSRRMSISFLPSLARFLLTTGRRFDIWHAHQAYYNALVALNIASLLGKRSVVKAAASGPYGDVARLRARRTGRWVEQALKRADAVISLNSELTEELTALGIDSTHVRHIPNGVDCAFFAPPTPQERLDARSKLGISPNAALVVFAGRLAEDKGIRFLLEAWRMIEQEPRACAWTLVVAGAERSIGEYRQQAERDLRSARFVGKVPDVRPLLQAADALVHPSLTEGLSNIVLEAMAMGVPVVGTAIGGLREQIKDGVSGLLVAPRDSRALVDALTRLLENAVLRREMGVAARATVEERYSLNAVIDAYENLYDHLADESVD